jgi:hypothetical protein
MFFKEHHTATSRVETILVDDNESWVLPQQNPKPVHAQELLPRTTHIQS